MSWAAVKRWRDRLAQTALPETGLSPQGADAVLTAALQALDDAALDAVAARGGTPYDTAVFVASGTVLTAPLEWLAVLLGRGTAVTLKVPAGSPGLAAVMEEAARAEGLALTVTHERTAVQHAELVVAMGADDTMDAIRASVGPETTFVAHGHAFSLAWVIDPASLDAVAEDAALHDGRGCLSPVVVLTRLELLDPLAEAMARAEQRLPRGVIDAAEGARIRTRGALARVVGDIRTGQTWSVHQLPAQHFEPIALPRSLALVQVADLAEARRLVAPWLQWLSTVGTDDPTVQQWGHARICRPGEMQRPPLVRLHDGRDWIAETLK